MGSNSNTHEKTEITPNSNIDGVPVATTATTVAIHENVHGVGNVDVNVNVNGNETGTNTYRPRNDFDFEEEEIIFVAETDGVGNDKHGNYLDAGHVDMETVSLRNKKKLEKFKTRRLIIDRLSKVENDDSVTYPADCYSFISVHRPTEIYFWFGVMVFSFQMLFLLFMILHVTLPDWRNGTVDDNPAQGGWFADFIATEASPMLRGAQFMSLFTFLVFVDASLMDLITAVHTFPKYKYITKRDNFGSMVVSCALRFSQGLAATIAAIFLIFTTNDVIDVILNFTALNFISTLDDMAFELAKSGKYGPTMERRAKQIEELPLPVCMFRKYKHIRFWFTVIPLAIALLVFFIYIAYMQDYSSKWDTQTLRLEFDRNSGLEDYNGCYRWNKQGKKFKRRFYDSDDHNFKKGQFGFCIEDRQWYLYEGDDVCDQDKIIIQSSETDTFDIATVFLDDWFDIRDTPVELYFIDQYEADNEFHCDQFLHNGICDIDLNTPSKNYDGGDCCASTCDHQDCWTGGLVNAFNSTNARGDGFSFCEDPEMRPLTIELNSFTNSRDLVKLSKESQAHVNNFIPDFYSKKPSGAQLWLSCDEVKVLKLYIDQSMENQSETVKVPDGSTCNIVIENTTSSNPRWNDDPIWYVNYTVFNGNNETTPIIVQRNTYETGDVLFEMIPDCFFNTIPNTDNNLNINSLDDPHSQAIKWLMDSRSKNWKKADCRYRLLERYALAVINFAAPIAPSNTSESSESAKTLWITPERECSWPNIVCGRGDLNLTDLIDLDLSGIGLSGYIPTEIGLIENLALYDASNNRLAGSIPTEIGELTHLSLLKLENNNLSGSIPTEIGALTLLQELFLQENRFHGTIPTEVRLLRNLIDLVLEDNALTGSIPSEIGFLNQLTILQIGGTNRLNGTIPSEIGLLEDLLVLNANNNTLIGTIPTEIGNLKLLSRLSIDKNPLTGTIPSEIGLLTSLTRLDIDETFLTGSFPTEIKNLNRLKRLYMDNVTISKDSLPTLLANKVAEKCTLCGGNAYEIVDKIVTDEDGYGTSCAVIHFDLKDATVGGRLSIEECNVLKDQCIVCSDSEELKDSSSKLSALNPLP
jgi:Leucine-rich repeat (LRR) protein